MTIVDATARRRDEDAQNVVIDELQHRIKNLLAVTCALARQTTVKDRTAEEYRDAFLGRFEALGKVLDVTIREDTELPALARAVLETYVGDGGPMALEKGPTLATNAVKYGALSVPDGRVTIVWTLNDKDNDTSYVNLRCRECNGPRVSPPTTGGFGTRLITFASERDLGGRVERVYHPAGLVYAMLSAASAALRRTHR